MALSLVALGTMVAIFLLPVVEGTQTPWPLTTPGITDGASLANRHVWEAMERLYVVSCVIDIENWTKFKLDKPDLKPQRGVYVDRPTTIEPATREAFMMKYVRNEAWGTYGTVSWLLEDLSRRMVILWSVPWRTSLYVNWMGMGVTNQNVIRDTGYWDRMYYKSNNAQINFIRKDFYYRWWDVAFSHAGIMMKGYMTSGLNARMYIKVMPSAAKWEEYAAASMKHRKP